jgi:hypothetical protein
MFVFVLAFFLDFFELAFIVVPLLGPVAVKLGIDLIWFGVLLGVNLQTSFMHPPFGFALFYLRSVAARDPYIDKPSGRLIQPVTTGQIYWGSIPFVVIQLIMVSLVIAFPQMVTHYKGTLPEPGSVKFEIPPVSTPSGTPFSDAPNFSSSPPPGLGGPATSPAPSGPPPGLTDAPPQTPPAGLTDAPKPTPPAGLSDAPKEAPPAGLTDAKEAPPAGLADAPKETPPASPAEPQKDAPSNPAPGQGESPKAN